MKLSVKLALNAFRKYERMTMSALCCKLVCNTAYDTFAIIMAERVHKNDHLYELDHLLERMSLQSTAH